MSYIDAPPWDDKAEELLATLRPGEWVFTAEQSKNLLPPDQPEE